MTHDKTDTIKGVADLARLNFDARELEVFALQFDKMLEYVGVIERLDLENVEPLLHVVHSENVFREDVAEKSLSTAEALANAPKHNDVFFKVPKVLK